MAKDLKGFADKYLKLYESNDTVERDVCATFADECFDLEIEMDCGKSFEDAYGVGLINSSTDYSSLLSQIEDVDILASAIFSMWRYITHWSEGESCLDNRNRAWFIQAFRRLSEITTQN